MSLYCTSQTRATPQILLQLFSVKLSIRKRSHLCAHDSWLLRDLSSALLSSSTPFNLSRSREEFNLPGENFVSPAIVERATVLRKNLYHPVFGGLCTFQCICNNSGSHSVKEKNLHGKRINNYQFFGTCSILLQWKFNYYNGFGDRTFCVY